ncbi:MAG: tetratricopeptide repeat protein [Oceanospirillaceae bacterium]|nr:tetratricopeptide repeat protein [Oceanospirillaceae bacterium]
MKRFFFILSLFLATFSVEGQTDTLEIAPDFTDAIVNRGSVKDENGDYNDALLDYEKALELKPREAMIYFNIGNTKYNQGKKSEACENWQKAKELGADYVEDRIAKMCE